MEKKVTAKEIIELVRRLPDAESHIHEWDGKQCITQEWLCDCKKHSIKTNYGFEICTKCGNEFND